MLLELIKKSYRVYKRYFGLKGRALYHSLLAMLILIGNISLAFVMALINAAFDTVMASIVPGVSYRAFLASTSHFLFVVLAYATIVSVNNWLAYKLSASVRDAHNHTLIQRWLNSGAYFGAKFLPTDKKNKKMNPAQIMSQDNNEITVNLSYLADNFLMTTSNFIIGFMGLVILSGPLIFPFMGFSIYIPDYLAVTTVIYALGFNLLSGWAANKLRHQQSQEKSAKDHFHHHLHHVSTHAESIAFSKGAKNEHSMLARIIKQYHSTDTKLGNIKSMLAFLNSLHQQMSGIFGVIISAPNVIAGHMDTTGVFQVAHHFSDVVRWFTWRNENLNTISETLVGLDRLNAFEDSLNAWESLKAHSIQNQITINQVSHAEPLRFSTLCVNTPPTDKNSAGTSLFAAPLTLSFPKGSISLVQGPSGTGKTTVFRAIANLWPFGEGTIQVPQNLAGTEANIIFIPQKPYFPYQQSLLDAIIYPDHQSTHPVSDAAKKQISEWMTQLGFKQETIEKMDTIQEWEKTLSGGEQQRIAIISALHKKPDFLFMDEGTSALDKETKKIAEHLMKTVLRDTTIAYIDHNPSEPSENTFYSHTLNLAEARPAVRTNPPKRIMAH